MSRAAALWFTSFALVTALSATACAEDPSTGKDTEEALIAELVANLRSAGAHASTTEPVEARLGPNRFMFPANL